jgi:hypothetical protein
VAQLLRKDADVDALGPQLGCVSMSQAMWVNALLDACLSAEFGEKPPDVALAELLAGSSAED